MHGFSSYAESFRRGFLKRIFYEDNGNIPKDQTLDRQYRCWDAHPGVCVKADRFEARLIVQIAETLRNYAVAVGEDGAFYRLHNYLRALG